MKLQEIKRESIAVPEWTEPSLSLAAEAKEVLGYCVLQQHQSRESASESVLLSTLATLGLEYLNPESVAAYQKERLIEQTARQVEAWKVNPAGNFFGPGWAKVEIEEYRDPIPEFVLNKAIQIKKALPEVRLYVEQLTNYPDPFLIAAIKHDKYDCLDAESVYVEVWEEPKFEGKL